MNKFLFSLSAIPNTSISIFDQYGQIIRPASNGFLGVLKNGTKLTIHIAVEPEVEHYCYTLNPNDITQKVAKKMVSPGNYVKNITVDTNTDESFIVPGNDGPVTIKVQMVKIARWPANMVCLEVPGHTYNIGITNQNGRLFFVIEEHLTSPEQDLGEGIVYSFSLLRGTGKVAYKPGFDARVHWKALPLDWRYGLRILHAGQTITWKKEDLVTLGGDTTFRYEIKKVE